MNPGILRIFDANCNRAREGLRVVEDYARFVLDDAPLCQRLKTLRHDFAQLASDQAGRAMDHRDTPGDVGATISTAAEQSRAGAADIVIAAGKRLGEALRSVEECLKALDPTRAAACEALRYRFYDIEQALARRFTPGRQRMRCVRLCVLITESVCGRPWLEAAGLALEGGADCLQLREKSLPASQLLDRARQLVGLCHRHGALCIINDRPDIALLSGADGVHVGQEDLPAIEARKIVGPDLIVGVSTHRIEQAQQALRDGADYLGAGPMFASATKPREVLAGLDYARAVAAQVNLHALAISGITLENLPEVIETGIGGVAVTAAVVAAPDIRAAARQFAQRLCPR